MPRPREAGALAKLLWLGALHLAGLLLFTRGFFLVRFEVPLSSSCSSSPSPLLVAHGGDAASGKLAGFNETVSGSARSGDAGAASAKAGCWLPRSFRRVVVLIVDALRYDMLEPDDGAGESHFRNGFGVVREYLERHPGRTKLLRGVADAPTMTMQRIKGLTTGGVPTFADVRSSFGSEAIVEDNLIAQLARAGRGAVFMGDDTWESLFPDSLRPPPFVRRYPYPSLDVHDLHTVDRGVLAHLYDELARGDWDLLVAHFLGVDHVGHRAGLDHPLMREKVAELDAAVRRALEAVDSAARREAPGDGTLFVLMGDHGMTATGDHGGETPEETEAGLFLYSPGSDWPELEPSSPWHLPRGARVPQVDLTPALSLSLGLPIPFASVGRAPPGLLPYASRPRGVSGALSRALGALWGVPDSGAAHAAHAARALHLNAWQLRRFVGEYSRTAPGQLDPDRLAHISRLFDSAEDRFRALLNGTSSPDRAAYDEAAAGYDAFLREAAALCRRSWGTLDRPTMAWGAAVLLASLLCALCMVLDPSDPAARWAPAALRPAAGAALGAALFSAICRLAPPAPGPALFDLVPPSGLVPLASAAGYLAARGRGGARRLARALRPPRSGADAAAWAGALLTAAHALGLLSVHFVETEHAAAPSLAALLLALAAARPLWPGPRPGPASPPASPSPSASPPPHSSSGSLGSLSSPSLRRLGLAARRGSLRSSSAGSASVVGGKPAPGAGPLEGAARAYAPLALLWGTLLASPPAGVRRRFLGAGALGAVLTAGYWLLGDAGRLDDAPLARLGLPRTVYALSLASAALAARGGPPGARAAARELSLSLLPALLLLAGPTAPLPFALVAAALRLASGSGWGVPPGDASSPRPAETAYRSLALAALGQALFFSTGHRMGFASLHYHSAFFGFDKFEYALSGTLLALNTFGPLLLAALALPALLPRGALPSAPYPPATTSSQERARAALLFPLYHSLQAFACVAFIAAEPRHLLMWSLFAPRFVFAAAHAAAAFAASAAAAALPLLRARPAPSSSEGKAHPE
eukprot:tig00021222_g19361.t1